MERICANCGNKSNEDTAFCTKCGTPYPTPEEEQQKIADKYLVRQPQVRNTPVQVRRFAVSFLRLLSGFIYIIGFCLIGYFVYAALIAIQPTPTINQSSAPIVVSQYQLISDYAKNEISADDKYQNHYLQISGIVQSISKDLFNNPYIVLAPNPDAVGSGIQCSFKASQESELATLQSGQPITVDGVGNGYTLGAVMVKNCSIVQSSSTSQ